MGSLGAELGFPLGDDATPAAADLASPDAYPHIAFVLIFEGYNLGVTDSNDWQRVAAAWAARTDWSNIVPGLDFDGVIERSCPPFDAEVQQPVMNFVMQDDDDDSIAGLMLREANDEALVDELVNSPTAEMTSDSPEILIGDSTAWPETGTAYIGTEEIAYALNGGGGLLTALTRGVRALFGTESDPLHFGMPHGITFNPDPLEPAIHSPRVSSVPLEWESRNCALYLCVENDGEWTAGSDAECVWAGTIRTPIDLGNGVGLECESILKRLETPIFRSQYRGYLEEGMYLGAANQGIVRVRLLTLDPNALYEEEIDVVATDGVYTHQDIAAAIQAQLAIWFDGSGTSFPADAVLDLVLVEQENGDFYQLRYKASGPSAIVGLELDFSISRLLGFRDPATQIFQRQGIGITTADSPKIADPGPPLTDYYVNTANFPPLFAALPILLTSIDGVTTTETIITVTNAQFEFTPQTNMPLDWFGTEANGFLKIGGKHIVAVKQRLDLGVGKFQHYGRLGRDFAPLGISPADGSDALADAEYNSLDGSSTTGIIVEQVWFEIGFTNEIMLRLLCSTGTPGYNSDDWDVYPEHLGLGVPWRMLDEGSFIDLLGGDHYVLFADKPRSFLELFESAMQRRNLHAIWHQGRLMIVGFGESGDADLILTSATEAQPVHDGEGLAPVIQFEQVARTLDYLVNQIQLRHNIPFGSFNSPKPTTRIVNNKASQTDRRKIATAEVDAIGFYDLPIVGGSGIVDDWEVNVAAPALAYFATPLMLIRITYNYSLLAELYPGRQVKLTNSKIMNPRTGERGVVELPVWVIATRFNTKTGVGEADLLCNPRNAP